MSRAAHDRVGESCRSRARRLDELDGLVDGRPIWDRVHPQELEDAQAQCVEHRRVDIAERSRGQRLQHELERAPALDRPIGETLGEGAVARVEPRPVGLRPEGAIGVGLFAVDSAQHAMGAGACRGSRHSGGVQLLAVAAQVRRGVHRPPAGRLDLE